ncbi:hypothetical protein GQ600_7384 [Phytophthora cactorum]|nr:hypothetical protein GQ600_7384 [Phytophthora cactorum]
MTAVSGAQQSTRRQLHQKASRIRSRSASASSCPTCTIDAVITESKKKQWVKWLKLKWVEYNSDMSATGNLELPVVEPPGLALMLEYWISSNLTLLTDLYI